MQWNGGKHTSGREGSFVSREGSISSPKGVVTLRIVRVIPYSLSREPSWILGSVESECGCTLACIARRNAAARVTNKCVCVWGVCEFAKERKERTKRKRERKQYNGCQHPRIYGQGPSSKPLTLIRKLLLLIPENE